MLFFYSAGVPRDLHSFPTRRSSDLPASTPFPYPAVSHEPRIQQLSDDLERRGMHPFHLPIGIDLDESDPEGDRKSTRLNSSHGYISYAVFCLKKKNVERLMYLPSSP